MDNGFGDGTWSWLTRRDDLRALRGSPSMGFGSAVNLGLTGVSGSYFLVLNPDTILPPGSIQSLRAALVPENDIGIVGPKLIRETGDLDLACRRGFPTPMNALFHILGLDRRFPRSRSMAGYNLLYLDPDEATDVDAISGAFMLMRREIFESIDGFDECFWMYGEDLDFCLRAYEGGWRVRYEPGIRVYHEKGISTSQRRIKTRFEFYRAMARFYNKHQASNHHIAAKTAVRAGILLIGSAGLGKEIMRYAARLISGPHDGD